MLIIDFIKRKLISNQKEIVINETEKIIVKNINWELIETLDEYDIVIVKMTKEEVDERNIDINHQIRPFVVVKKEEKTNSVKGYYLTSNLHQKYFSKNRFRGMKIILSESKYNLHKSSLLSYIQQIDLPYENILRYIDSLEIEDIGKLKKYRSIIANNPIISNNKDKIIEIGDIILKSGFKYLIYQVDNTNYYGYLIQRSKDIVDIEENHNYIEYLGKIYYIDYRNNKIFDNEQVVCIVDKFSKEIVDRIKHNKKLLKIDKKENVKKKIKNMK